MFKVVLAKDTYNPNNLPDNWPREILPEEKSTDKPFTLMSQEQLDSHKALYQSEFDAWLANENEQKVIRNYVAYRMAEYPNFGDQLDCIYRCTKSGDFTEFHEMIEEIKNRYPKE